MMARPALVIMVGLVITCLPVQSSVLPNSELGNADDLNAPEGANQRHKIKLAPAPVHVKLRRLPKEGEVVVVPKANKVHHLNKHGAHHSAHESVRPRHHRNHNRNRNLRQQKSNGKLHVQTERLNKHGSHPSVGHHANSTVHRDSTRIHQHLKNAEHRSTHHQKTAGHAPAGKRFHRQHKKTGDRIQSHQEANKPGTEGKRTESNAGNVMAEKYDELWSLIDGHHGRKNPLALLASDDEEHRSSVKVKKGKEAALGHRKKVVFASHALRHSKHGRLWQRLFRTIMPGIYGGKKTMTSIQMTFPPTRNAETITKVRAMNDHEDRKRKVLFQQFEKENTLSMKKRDQEKKLFEGRLRNLQNTRCKIRSLSPTKHEIGLAANEAWKKNNRRPATEFGPRRNAELLEKDKDEVLKEHRAESADHTHLLSPPETPPSGATETQHQGKQKDRKETFNDTRVSQESQKSHKPSERCEAIIHDVDGTSASTGPSNLCLPSIAPQTPPTTTRHKDHHQSKVAQEDPKTSVAPDLTAARLGEWLNKLSSTVDTSSEHTSHEAVKNSNHCDLDVSQNDAREWENVVGARRTRGRFYIHPATCEMMKPSNVVSRVEEMSGRAGILAWLGLDFEAILPS
ncbi:Hypp5969 [Branchiostoma lanceolatum]|uniref:Hypp5969 protein n=1 Tax=Branchiostoma lanceolatum TaxID=7740 RepID=A0A8J9YS63_BRALA|nr:Hypp5969 [Branchiostoma lanceolatum]